MYCDARVVLCDYATAGVATAGVGTTRRILRIHSIRIKISRAVCVASKAKLASRVARG